MRYDTYRPASRADERATLTGFLDQQRAKVQEKRAGLTDEGTANAPLPSSPLMAIGGLVNHLSWVEYDWWSGSSPLGHLDLIREEWDGVTGH